MDDRSRLFVRILFGQILVMIVIVVSIWVSSYQGRVNLVDSQRQGCERGKLDRVANARGWRIAQEARQREGNIRIANAYADIAVGLENRSHVDCDKAYPHPRLLEFASSST
jgi:hypothetical protein